ncbi:MAG: discoidin domain-containing protein [Candidatus Brocadiae bacterium]|nr:discoidin domain-containing protein [Candidatus Brocadiia bacterium]
MQKTSVLFLVLLLFSLFFLPIHATPILLSEGKSVTGSSYYNSGSEVFPYSKIVDGRYNDTGTGYDWSFWLTPNSSSAYAVIDLGNVYSLSRFEVQNTHNRVHNDRGTKDFRISVSADGINYTSVVSTTLAAVWGLNPIPIETFHISSYQARYVRFDIDTWYGNGGGINELSVYGEAANVPESESLLLALTGLLATLGLKISRKNSIKK